MAEADPKLLEGIHFFEQMLEANPGDQTSLEFLSVAYDQVGEEDKSRRCALRLVGVLLKEKELEKAANLAANLKSRFSDDETLGVVEQVKAALEAHQLHPTPAPTATPRETKAAPAVEMNVHAISRTAVTEELDLIWTWKEEGFLDEEVCMELIHDLTERPVSDVPMLISAMTLLDECHPQLIDGVMAAMAKKSGVAPIPLELFADGGASLMGKLPQLYMQIRGVIPFGRLGECTLVAFLNPLSERFQQEVSTLVGGPCYFYLVHPSAVAARLKSLDNAQAAA